VPESKRGKRRRGAQQARSSAGMPSTKAKPVGPTNVNSSIPGLPWLVGGGIVLVIIVVGLLVLRPFGGGTGGSGGAAASASPGAASPGGSVAAGSCPTSQPPPLPAGETRTVTIQTDKGAMGLKIEADLSPIAAGQFVALASCGFYDGSPFHRVVPDFVIQGGGSGTGGDLGYTIQDEKVTAKYARGVVAMARTSQPNSVDSQFFIVLSEEAVEALAAYNTYQIIGNVTSGMETADAIASAADAENPSDPVIMTSVTVATP
jgi:cyclophilin family peptidyl-prolyl cis-trans isomerase